MDPFECTLVLRPSQAPVSDGPLFWPAGRARLVLLFESLTDNIIVRGIDPDVVDRSVLVFRAELSPTQKDRFIQAVREGDEPTLISPVGNDNQGLDAPVPAARKPGRLLARKAVAGKTHIDAIVITDPPGPGQGPKTYLLELPSVARATGTRG